MATHGGLNGVKNKSEIKEPDKENQMILKKLNVNIWMKIKIIQWTSKTKT